MPTPVADEFDFIRERLKQIRNDEPIDRTPAVPDTEPQPQPMQPDYYCE